MREIEVRRDHGQAQEADMDRFEQSLAIRLPVAYRQLLLAHNAPRLEHEDFDFIEVATGKPTSRDVAFFGYGAALPRSARIADQQDSDGAWQDHIVTFGCCANGDYVCFDYRRDPASDEPAVAVMYHDWPDDHGKMLVHHVADSFGEFLGLLYGEAP